VLKSSQVIIYVNVDLEANVSEISISTIRVNVVNDHIDPDGGDR
jgi:hypothetical protein